MEELKTKYPSIMIMGTEFLVDVANEEFRQKDNEQNSFSFYQMQYKGSHYEMAYDERLKNPLFANSKCIVRIPQLIEVDPEGMAEKYNLSVGDLAGKTDFDLRVDQEIFQDRLWFGIPPVIDIDGDRFFVDMRWDELRYTKDISKRIILCDHQDEASGNYYFYYDQSTKQAVNIDPGITQLPFGVIRVEVPDTYVLDPLEEARRINPFRPKRGINEIKDFLMKEPFHKDLKAKVIPLSETELVERMKVNKEADKVDKQDLLLEKRRETKLGKRL